MSDIGGLIGLFLGFSLLSVFELLLNICSYLKMKANHIIDKLNETDESPKDNSLTEVISVREYESHQDESNEVQQNESIFMI